MTNDARIPFSRLRELAEAQLGRLSDEEFLEILEESGVYQLIVDLVVEDLLTA
jgi:hypothetical protein